MTTERREAFRVAASACCHLPADGALDREYPLPSQVKSFIETIYLGAVQHHFQDPRVTFEWMTQWEDALDYGQPPVRLQVTSRDREYEVEVTRQGDFTLLVEHTEVFQTEYRLDYRQALLEEGDA